MGVNKKPRSKRLHTKRSRDSKNEAAEIQQPATSLGKVIDSVVPRFRGFYESSGLSFSEYEWKQLIRSLRSALPVSFRLRDPTTIVPESKFITSLGFANAYQIDIDPKKLKVELPELNSWLIENNKRGFISRQEVVSMIPVAVLGIKRNHRVLEMCSSPGSKTTQASDIAVEGVVVANELSRSRSHTLANRAAAKNVIVTCHKAQTFPDACGPFDRIICDVPCSGDGAIRKYVDKWAHWDPTVGRQLHATQLQIAMRAARLLRVGGQMTYSTCSLNPIENEAVVAALIKATDGALALVTKTIPALQVSPGLTNWQVIDEELNIVSEVTSSRYRESMFCGGGQNTFNCMRLYPHLNNSGGFFVALLKKVKEWPAVQITRSFKKEFDRFELANEGGQVAVKKSKKLFNVNQATAAFLTQPGAEFINVVSAGVKR